MSKNRKAHPELVSERVKPILPWSDDERIQTYVSVGHDLVQKTPLGHQLECFRDNVRITGMPATHPPGDWGYGGTAYHRARETALRLWDTERASAGSVAVLWAYCHPTAVALDGLPGGRGRLFATYPETELGRRARRSAGGKDECSLDASRLLGPRRCECSGRDCSCHSRPTLLRRLYAEFVEAKGELRVTWNAIDAQAEARVRAAADAWLCSRGREDERRQASQAMRRAGARLQRVTVASSDG